MSIQKTQAILLNKREIRETSCIVNFFTKDFGKIAGLIKGVRGPRAVFGTYIQEFVGYDIVYYEKKRKNIYTIAECSVRHIYKKLNTDFSKRLWAFYVIELADKFTEPEDANIDIFYLLENTLKLLDAETSTEKTVINFQIRLLKYVGLMPQMDFCVNCNHNLNEQLNLYFSTRFAGFLCRKCFQADIQSFLVSKGAVASLKALLNTPINNIARINIGKKFTDEISIILNRFIDYQLGEHLKTIRFIRSVS